MFDYTCLFVMLFLVDFYLFWIVISEKIHCCHGTMLKCIHCHYLYDVAFTRSQFIIILVCGCPWIYDFSCEYDVTLLFLFRAYALYAHSTCLTDKRFALYGAFVMSYSFSRGFPLWVWRHINFPFPCIRFLCAFYIFDR